MLYKLRMQFYVEAPIILNRIKKPYWKVSSAFISVPDYIFNLNRISTYFVNKFLTIILLSIS